jgi:hypothetical protein
LIWWKRDFDIWNIWKKSFYYYFLGLEVSRSFFLFA